MDHSERINRYLALQLGISRREADELVDERRVEINGISANLGDRITPADTLTVNGKPVARDTALVYLAFHKPVGYVCSRRAQGDAPTIYEILPKEYHTLKPVGRLDKNSSGLILLTNDGTFAHQMTHPSFYKTKVYEVELDTPLQPLHQQMISDFGVLLEDGKSQFMVEKNDEKTNAYQITMSEGRNRQIRRTFAALGYTVTALHRTIFGAYSLNQLAAGMHDVLQITEASSHQSTE